MDFIKIYDNIVSEENCSAIIDAAENIIGREDPGHGVKQMPNGVSVDCHMYGSINRLRELFVEPFWQCWNDYSKSFDVTNRTFPETLDEHWIVEKTHMGEFKDKHEQSSAFERDRFAAWILFLNTMDTNVEEFVNQDLTIKPVTGRIVIFPASFTHKHRQLDLHGNRYVSRGWFRYPERGGIIKT